MQSVLNQQVFYFEFDFKVFFLFAASFLLLHVVYDIVSGRQNWSRVLALPFETFVTLAPFVHWYFMKLYRLSLRSGDSFHFSRLASYAWIHGFGDGKGNLDDRIYTGYVWCFWVLLVIGIFERAVGRKLRSNVCFLFVGLCVVDFLLMPFTSFVITTT